MLDTEDDWTGEFNNINLLKSGELISYTVREDAPKNYRLIETPQMPNSNVTAKTATYLYEETLGDDASHSQISSHLNLNLIRFQHRSLTTRGITVPIVKKIKKNQRHFLKQTIQLPSS